MTADAPASDNRLLFPCHAAVWSETAILIEIKEIGITDNLRICCLECGSAPQINHKLRNSPACTAATLFVDLVPRVEAKRLHQLGPFKFSSQAAIAACRCLSLAG
jgi:hypothetical protein